MDAVIYLDSSDDEDEPVCGEGPSSTQPAPVRSQHLVEVNCKEEPDVEQSAGPSFEGEPRSMNGGASHGQDASALVQRKGKMRHDERLAAQPEGASLCRQFWQAGNYEDHPPKRRRTVQGTSLSVMQIGF